MSNKIQKLNEFENQWRTDLGAWFPGERVVFRGKDLHKDLSDFSFTQMLYFAATGRVFEGGILYFMDTANTICSSFPDPRLWNNRIAALAGTTRSTAALALAAGNAVTEANIYGGRAILKASDLLHRIKRKIALGEKLEDVVDAELKTYRSLPGYGRPIINSDERIEPLLKNAEKAGLKKGDFFKLAFEIENYLLRSRRRFKLNINGVLAAILADEGLNPREYNLVCLLAFSVGILACFVDAADHEEGAFFPFPVKKINYLGESMRSW